MNSQLRAHRGALTASQRTNATSESATIQEILLNQSEQIAYQQEQLNDLGKGFRDIAEILQKQHQSNPAKAIEENNKGILSLGELMLSLAKQLKEAKFKEGFDEIKSNQQSIGKVVSNNHKNLEAQKSSLAYYLGWKRILMIIVSTVAVFSLCSMAISTLMPLAIDQITKSDQPKNIEKKAEPVVKKRKGSRS
jgi:hypothetical protein